MKKEGSSSNRLLPGKCFLHFFPELWSHFENMTPHNKKQIRNLVWNKNVNQVESSHKSLWKKF